MKDLSVEALRKILCDTDTKPDAIVLSNIEVPFQIDSKQFLKFAGYDLNSEYEHHLVNALSNVKRALDCQIDSLLFGFGLFEKSRKEHWSFPTKVDFIKTLGIISPRILKRINQQRNLLEHEYKKPLKEEVENALDVAILFEAYTENFLTKAITNCFHIGSEKEGKLEITMNYSKNEITFAAIQEGTKENLEKLTKTISPHDPEYIEYLKVFVSLYKLI